MTAIELLRDDSAPGQAHEVDGVNGCNIEQSREGVGPVGSREHVGRIRRFAGARCIPGDDGEVGAKCSELRAPHAGVDEEAVEEHERGAGSSPSVGDCEPIDLSA